MSTWILLRGLTREAAHWGAFPETLIQGLNLDDSQWLTLDLPGNGARHTEPSPWSIADMVSACREDLRRRGVEPPYRLLAMSLGAMVATEWARVAPQDVQLCVLINTSFRPFSGVFQRLRPRCYASLMRLAFFERDPLAIERAMWRLTSNRKPPDVATLAGWVAVRETRPVSTGNAVRQLVAAALYRAPITPPIDRVLLLGSEGDRLVDIACSRAIARDWGVSLMLHTWAGHDLPLDDPKWVVNQIQCWLVDIQSDNW